MVLNRNFSCINNDDLWSLKGVTKEDENDKRSVLLIRIPRKKMIVISILVAMTVGGNQSVHMNWWFQIWEWTPQHRPPTTNREWTNKRDDWVLWLCQLIHCAMTEEGVFHIKSSLDRNASLSRLINVLISCCVRPKGHGDATHGLLLWASWGQYFIALLRVWWPASLQDILRERSL